MMSHSSHLNNGSLSSQNFYNCSINSSTNSVASFQSSNSIYEGDEIGTLIIIVAKAKNLANRRSISKQNPYCSIRIGKHADRTPTEVRGGQTPSWDHEIRFKLTSQDCLHKLKLCIFDQNGNNTEIIGDAIVPINPALEASTKIGYDNWYPIKYNSKYVGEVYLEMTFYPRSKSFRKKRASLNKSGSVSSNRSMHANPLSSSDGSQASRGSRPLPTPPKQAPSSDAVKTMDLDFSSDQIPNLVSHVAQEDISRQINNGYEESLFERLRPN